MKTVEDALDLISANLWRPEIIAALGDPWFIKFINDVSTRLATSGKPLTTSQANICIKAIARCAHAFGSMNVSPDTVAELLSEPTYRRPVVQSRNIPRQVRYLGQNLLGFRFKINEGITKKLKLTLSTMAFNTDKQSPYGWDFVNNIWVMPVTPETYEVCMDLIGNDGFEFDDDVLAVLARCKDAEFMASSCVLDPQTGEILINVCNNGLLGQWIETALDGRPL